MTAQPGDRVRIIREDSSNFGRDGIAIEWHPLMPKNLCVRLDGAGHYVVEHPESLLVLPRPKGAA